MALHPEVFQQEQARVRERFESAVEFANRHSEQPGTLWEPLAAGVPQ